MAKAYDPRQIGNGTWTMATESMSVEEMSVREMMDALIIKIRNSNGLEFCPKEQIFAMAEVLTAELRSRMG